MYSEKGPTSCAVGHLRRAAVRERKVLDRLSPTYVVNRAVEKKWSWRKQWDPDWNQQQAEKSSSRMVHMNVKIPSQSRESSLIQAL